MIGEMKREALGALKGKWGLSVGSTVLHFVLTYVVSFITTFVVMIPGAILLIGIGLLGAFGEGTLTAGGAILLMLFYAVIAIASMAACGVTMYGYTNICVQLSRGKNTTVDALFEGFRGFKKMIKTMKVMVLIFVYTGIWAMFILLGALLIWGNSVSSSEFLGLILFALLLISFIVPIVMYFSYAMAYFVMVDHPEYSALQVMKESKALMKGHKQDLFMLWLSFIGWAILAIITFGIGLLWLYPYVMTTTAVFYNKISNNNETKHEH